VNRPCISCGDVISSGSRCDDCKLPAKPRARPKGHHRNTERWKQLSRRLRRLSPFCELCGATRLLEVDHVIPYEEALMLGIDEYNQHNLRVCCKSCNGRRGDRVTEQERAEVLARINAQPRNRAGTITPSAVAAPRGRP
jgi:5-methylcytosine-specific restriction endonuclease McrA